MFRIPDTFRLRTLHYQASWDSKTAGSEGDDAFDSSWFMQERQQPTRALFHRWWSKIDLTLN